MPIRLVSALRVVVMLAFVLASVGSHGSTAADALGHPLGHPSLQGLADQAAPAPHNAASCDRHGGGIRHGSCCVLGPCMLGILWPASTPLPQPEPLMPAGSPARTLAGASPETPYRPPA